MMLSRRRLLTGSVLAATFLVSLRAFPGIVVPAWAAQDGGSPQAALAFIKQEAGKLTASLAAGGTPAERAARLQPIIDEAVDVPNVARFCLGRFWRVATPAQQQQYVQLFHTVLVRNITGRLGDYNGGVTVTYGNAVQREDGYEVQTVVNRPGNAPANVTWVVSFASGAPKIVDVIAEGTSLRLTQRSDYASFITRNGGQIEALLTALQRQAAA